MTVSNYEYRPDDGTVAVMYDRKDEEYVADFIAISKRTLNPSEYRLFNYHFLLGADWKLCCTRLNMDRGNFFHAVYRIQQKLGRAFRETEPYGIFPLYAYYEDQRVPAEALPVGEDVNAEPLDGFPPRIMPVRADYPYQTEEERGRGRRIA